MALQTTAGYGGPSVSSLPWHMSAAGLHQCGLATRRRHTLTSVSASPTSHVFQALTHCTGQCAKPIDDRGSTISISYSTGVDILSDLLIMLLPMRLLQTMRITRVQKVALGSIFCVGWMIVVFAIVRATQILGRARTDPVGLAVWGVVESSVSVVAGCLPALRRYVCGALGRKLRRETRTLSWRAPRMRSYDEPLTTAPISRSSGRSCSIVLQDRSDSRNDAASAHISIPAKA